MKIICPECRFSRDVPNAKIPATAKLATCPKCGHKFRFRNVGEAEDQPQQHAEQDAGAEPARSQEASSPAQDDPSEDIWSTLESLDDEGSPPYDPVSGPTDRSAHSGGDIPWEELQSYGFFPGFFQTVKRVMLAPSAFFRSMFLGRGLSRPLIFYLLVAEVQALAQFFWQMTGVVPHMQNQTAGLLGLGMMGLGSIFLLVLYPVFLSAMLFVVSGLNHLCLRIVRDGANGYEGTFRVISYANAPMVLAVVPSLGPLVGVVWTLICTFIGFKTVHQTSPAKVLLAMLLPFVFALVLSSFLFMLKGIPQM